jgi:transcriptional regulator with XRE-family HTH domain
MNELGAELARRRGSQGIRAAAGEIGVSAATLSRVENGHIPDLETLTKICRWLEIDVGDVLGRREAPKASEAQVQIAFKKKQALREETARSLTNLILAAHAAFQRVVEEESL